MKKSGKCRLRTRVVCVKVHRANHCSIATDVKLLQEWLILNAASHKMSKNSYTYKTVLSQIWRILVCNQNKKHPKWKFVILKNIQCNNEQFCLYLTIL